MGKTKDGKQLEKELKEKLVFMTMFPSLIKLETSNLGKLILQENYLSNILRASILLASNYLNALSKKTKLLNYKIPNRDDLVPYSFGKLVLLYKKLIINRNDIFQKLDDYNKTRNELTHQMLEKFNNKESVDKIAHKATLLGEENIKTLREIHTELIEEVLEYYYKEN